MPTEAVAEAVEPAEPMTTEVADADDEAVLEMVALEMAAPDPDEADDDWDADTNGAHVTTPPAVEPIVVATALEPVAEPTPPRQPTALPPAWPSAPSPLPEPEPPISVEPALELSLGPSLGLPWAVARFDADRQRIPAAAEVDRRRPAGADPAHEPGREDRVLLLVGSLRQSVSLRRSASRTDPHPHCRRRER